MPIANDGEPADLRPRHSAGPAGRPALPEAPRRARATQVPRDRSMGASVAWTLLGTVLPGLGLLPTRRRKLGLALFGLVVAVVGAVAWEARRDLGTLAGVAVRPAWLTALAVLCVVAAVVMVLLITSTHLLTRPRHPSPGQRAGGAVLVGLLCFVVTAPLGMVANIARTQAGLVNGLFEHGSSRRSQTRPMLNGRDPFADKPRLNILLLGGDSSAVRDKEDPTAGNRTDTMMLASIDTATGNTALVQLPRNLEAFPFPPGSPLAAAYPQGFWTGQEGDRENPEYELNAVWENVPRDHPELFAQTDYKNADALKAAVEGITGLKPDYFLLLNIDGLQKLIDAMGGLTINVNERIPMGQSTEQFEAGIAPSGGYLEKGPDRHLSGYEAMWYARSRSQSKDPDRMARQGCVVKAIVEQANPQTLLTHYDQIASASRTALLTDIPQELAPALMGLGVEMKDARIKRVLFGYPTTKYLDGTPFEPWNPDVTKMRQLIDKGIEASMATPTTAPAAPAATHQPTTAQEPTVESPSPAATSAETSSDQTAQEQGTATPTPSVDASADLKDACAWHG